MGRLPVFLEEGDIYQLFKTPFLTVFEAVKSWSFSPIIIFSSDFKKYLLVF